MKKKKFLTYLVVVLVNILAIELIVRVFIGVDLLPEKVRKFLDYTVEWHTQGEMDIVNEAASYIRIKPSTEFQDLNAHGFHSPEIPLERSSDKKRIAFVGGSTTYDRGPVEETYAHFTAKRLKENGMNVEYLNAGASGYTSTECLFAYHIRIEQWKPDLLIFYNGRNELIASGNNRYSYLDLSDRHQPPYYSRPPEFHQVLARISYLYAMFSELVGLHAFRINHWNIRGFLDQSYRNKLGVPKTVDRFFENKQNNDIYKIYRKNVESLALLTALNQTNLLLVGFDFRSEKLSSQAIPIDRELTPEEFEFMNNQIVQLNGILDGISSKYEHVFYYNLDDKINGEFFTDDCHLTAEGNEMKGRLIADYISMNISSSFLHGNGDSQPSVSENIE